MNFIVKLFEFQNKIAKYRLKTKEKTKIHGKKIIKIIKNKHVVYFILPLIYDNVRLILYDWVRSTANSVNQHFDNKNILHFWNWFHCIVLIFNCFILPSYLLFGIARNDQFGQIRWHNIFTIYHSPSECNCIQLKFNRLQQQVHWWNLIFSFYFRFTFQKNSIYYSSVCHSRYGLTKQNIQC